MRFKEKFENRNRAFLLILFTAKRNEEGKPFFVMSDDEDFDDEEFEDDDFDDGFDNEFDFGDDDDDFEDEDDLDGFGIDDEGEFDES